jgi:hypothetical protein
MFSPRLFPDVPEPIDVWDVRTFDRELLTALRLNAALIRDYAVTERANFLQLASSDHRLPYQRNPHTQAYGQLVKNIASCTKAKAIRAWHYTRLTGPEVDIIRKAGLYPGTLETLRQRLELQVAAGPLSANIAAALFAASPVHKQSDARSNKFWMTLRPKAIDDGDVELLLGNWGGEAVYFWLQDAALKKLVARIGKPRVLELAVPIDGTRHDCRVGEAIVRTFGRTLGCGTDTEGFDLYVTRELGAEAVIAIHSEGDPAFASLGRGYPQGFGGSPLTVSESIRI